MAMLLTPCTARHFLPNNETLSLHAPVLSYPTESTLDTVCPLGSRASLALMVSYLVCAAMRRPFLETPVTLSTLVHPGPPEGHTGNTCRAERVSLVLHLSELTACRAQASPQVAQLFCRLQYPCICSARDQFHPPQQREGEACVAGHDSP